MPPAYLRLQGRFHFVSSDYGATFKALPTPGDTEGYGQEIRPHPRQPDWLLARVRRNDCIADRRRWEAQQAGWLAAARSGQGRASQGGQANRTAGPGITTSSACASTPPMRVAAAAPYLIASVAALGARTISLCHRTLPPAGPTSPPTQRAASAASATLTGDARWRCELRRIGCTLLCQQGMGWAVPCAG
jgi:hypothetical protein